MSFYLAHCQKCLNDLLLKQFVIQMSTDVFEVCHVCEVCESHPSFTETLERQNMIRKCCKCNELKTLSEFETNEKYRRNRITHCCKDCCRPIDISSDSDDSSDSDSSSDWEP